MQHSRPNRGFTLIELLVVIAIIAILAAILFPVFAQARAKARQTGCTSNMRQLALAAQMYRQDYDELAPGWWGNPDPSAGWQPWEATGYVQPKRASGAHLPALLNPYLKNNGVKRCPSDTGPTPGGGTPYWVTYGTTPDDGTSYPFNPIVACLNPDIEPPHPRYLASLKIDANPNNRCMFWDGQYWHAFKSTSSRQMIMWGGNVKLVTDANETRSFIW